ncbi:MAG TPA: heparan-alpha-glucosaminide N-acetyltransferase domain-containing protein [Gemmatales bacterium]|nr:heparan-alpha-glucosaminide N-acetyltransferase domain-containing protein [Gemmatales bacterium]
MNRYLSIDVLRGLIMIIMAIDHTIGNFGDPHPGEIALDAPFTFPGYTSLTSQWSRLITHLCAPGFQLLAGMGLALSVTRSRQQGVSEWLITRDLLVRGTVLILMDIVLMGFVYQSPFLFLVLCCIGSCTLCFAVLRFLPKHVIGMVGMAIIGLAPWYAPREVVFDNGIISYLGNIWTNISFPKDGWYAVMYPILPWLGIFALGWWIGLILSEHRNGERLTKESIGLIVAGLAMAITALVLRSMGIAYAERVPLNGATIFDSKFWLFAKYPPSLVFMLLTIGILLFLLGLLRNVDRLQKAPLWCQFISVYGRTALFFFVVHFYVLGIAAWMCGFIPGVQYEHRYSFATAYLVWAAVVLGLWPVCYGYDKLRQRYRSVLRYF